MPSRHRWIIDRIEEQVAAIEEDGARVVHVPRALLPDGAREGDVLAVEREGAGDEVRLRIRRDPAATAAALARSRAQLRQAPKGGKGDIVL